MILGPGNVQLFAAHKPHACGCGRNVSVPFPLLHGNNIIQVILLLWNIRTADCTNSLCWNKLTSAALLHFTSFAHAIHSLLALADEKKKQTNKTQKPHMDFSSVHSVCGF